MSRMTFWGTGYLAKEVSASTICAASWPAAEAFQIESGVIR